MLQEQIGFQFYLLSIKYFYNNTLKSDWEMPGFVIFVLVLTFAYVVYFSVMITLDLHSKKDEKKTDEETIDVSSMDNEEVPVSVE